MRGEWTLHKGGRELDKRRKGPKHGVLVHGVLRGPIHGKGQYKRRATFMVLRYPTKWHQIHLFYNRDVVLFVSVLRSKGIILPSPTLPFCSGLFTCTFHCRVWSHAVWSFWWRLPEDCWDHQVTRDQLAHSAVKQRRPHRASTKQAPGPRGSVPRTTAGVPVINAISRRS